MASKSKLSQALDDSSSYLANAKDVVKQARKSERETPKSFKKPTSDYYRLDLVVRGTKAEKTTYTTKKGTKVITPVDIQTETIVKDYKSYLSDMAQADGISLTKYIHKLIDADMELNEKKYKKILKAKQG